MSFSRLSPSRTPASNRSETITHKHSKSVAQVVLRWLIGRGIVAIPKSVRKARMAWHKHPAGQTLIVTEGIGWTQAEGGPVLEFYAGDVLWCPADRKHWHGATPHDGMTHIAIQESVNGSPVTWMEHVTDEEYLAGPTKDPS